MKTRLPASLLLFGTCLLLGTRCLASSITLVLDAPKDLGCGDVSVNGYVWASDGTIDRVAWSWGDGTANENWFPAEHDYPRNGTYVAQATAFATVGGPRTHAVVVTVTNADPARCNHIFLALSHPSYAGCGEVSFDTSVGTSDGSSLSRVTSHAVPDTVYLIQSSPDLSHWTSIQTDTATDFIIAVADLIPDPATRQFYRVVQWR